MGWWNAGRVLSVACFCSLVYAQGAPRSDRDLPEKFKGFDFAAWSADAYLGKDAEDALGALKELGSNWVGIVLTYYQSDANSTEIGSEPVPSRKAVENAVRIAHKLGLRVMLKPHVDLSGDPSSWRGEIGRSFSRSEWQTWFRNYQAILLEAAKLSAEHSVDLLAIGTELKTASRVEKFWRQLARTVRQNYQGPLVYCANHDEAESVLWWDAVEYIGVDAYFGLNPRGKELSEDDLVEAWQPWGKRLKKLSEKWRKPVLFTEIGYRSVKNASLDPWNWQRGGELDLEEQRNCYRAAFRVFWDRAWFAGFFWWNWDADPNAGGPQDKGFTPKGKPAEALIRSYYGQQQK